MYSDPSGHFLLELLAAFVLLCTPVGGAVFQAVVSTACYAGFAVASLFNKDIRKDMQDIGFNMFNTDEALVLQSQKVSFYKGRPYFKVPGDSGFSFGAIFFGKNIQDTNLVKHEYGHTFQLAEQGPLGYLIQTVIPSVTGFIADKFELLTKMGIEYESLPWEYNADHFGGVVRKDSQNNIIQKSNLTFWDVLMLLLFR
jgi:hypothetical protein